MVASIPRAEKGVLDLRKFDFKNGEIIELKGDWEFYPDKLYKPEDFWQDPLNFENIQKFAPVTTNWKDYPELNDGNKEFGKATYRLVILFPKVFPKQAIAFRDMSSAYEVYINGKGFEGSGEVGNSKESSRPDWRNATKTAGFVAGKNEIVLKVSNYHDSQGGALKPVLIGDSEAVFYTRNLEIGGILFLTGCLLLAGIFALGLFWFKTTDLQGLFFFLFCGFFAIFVFSSGPHLLQLVFKKWTWVFSVRLMYVSLYASVICYGYFLLKAFNELFKPTIFHVISGLSTVMILITLFTPPAFFTQLQVFYSMLILLTLVGLSLVGINDSSFKHKLTWVNALGVGALFLFLLQQICVYFNLISHWPLFEVLALVVFIFSQALVMAVKFGRDYRESSMAALAAAKTREEFLNAMSHELKTPMNAIIGMATFLENSKLKPAQQDKLKAIRDNADSLMSMINDVLSISELGSGELKIKESVLDLESSIDSAISLSKQHLNKDKVDFKFYLDPEIPALLRGDASRIKQVLMHLLNNAFKFTEKGEVTLRVKLEEQLEEKVKLSFCVKDTGIGMRLSGDNVLSSFSNSISHKNKLKTSNRLSVTEELLEMMGGKLEIQSKKNEGTTVSFILELDEYFKDPVKVTSLFRKSEIDTSLKILYAEDNPVNQKLMGMMLDSLGLKVEFADNGEEAVQMAMKKYYNIILMDIQMPVMDGIEATKRIVEYSSSRPIIVATTANMAGIDRRMCFEVGMNDFLSKPLRQDDLRLVILKWQGLKEYLDDSPDQTIKLTS